MQQKKIATDKLKFDLYEKRFKIYKTVNDYILRVVRETAQGSQESGPLLDFQSWVNFNLETKDTPFLFDTDITDYLAEIRNKTEELIKVCNMLKDVNSFPMYSQGRGIKLGEYKYLSKLLQDDIYLVEKHFESYLGFKHLK
jgi:hypothetical protein